MLVLWLPWCSQALAHIPLHAKKLLNTCYWDMALPNTLNLTRDPSGKIHHYFLGLLDPILGYIILWKLTSTPCINYHSLWNGVTRFQKAEITQYKISIKEAINWYYSKQEGPVNWFRGTFLLNFKKACFNPPKMT